MIWKKTPLGIAELNMVILTPQALDGFFTLQQTAPAACLCLQFTSNQTLTSPAPMHPDDRYVPKTVSTKVEVDLLQPLQPSPLCGTPDRPQGLTLAAPPQSKREYGDKQPSRCRTHTADASGMLKPAKPPPPKS